MEQKRPRGRPPKNREIVAPVAVVEEVKDDLSNIVLSGTDLKTRAALVNVLRQRALLSEEDAMKLGDKYIKLSAFGAAVRAGEDMGFKDPETINRLRIIGLSR